VARGRRARLGVDEHVTRDRTLRDAPRARRAAPKHCAHHASTRPRKAALTRRERVAHTPGPSRARATLTRRKQAAGPRRGRPRHSRGRAAPARHGRELGGQGGARPRTGAATSG
jgi:hypothetical protein